MTLTAAVTTFNGLHLLRQTLPSVLASKIDEDFDVVVIDDGSTDGTAEWLATEYPEVAVVRHDRNRGVAAAMNSALAKAAESDHIALLNNDVELAPDALAQLCRALDGEPRAAAVSPKMLNYFDRGALDGTGDLYAWIGWARRRGRGERDMGQFDAPGPVFGVCGGAAVFLSAAVRDVGGFDEDFFAYYEDVDWAVRANLTGYRCLYEPRAVVYHMDGATTGTGLTPFRAYYSWRNAIWVVAKNWSTTELLRHGWLFGVGQVLTAVFAIRQGLVGELTRAWRDAVRGLPAMWCKRQPRKPSAPSLELPWVGADLRALRGGR